METDLLLRLAVQFLLSSVLVVIVICRAGKMGPDVVNTAIAAYILLGAFAFGMLIDVLTNPFKAESWPVLAGLAGIVLLLWHRRLEWAHGFPAVFSRSRKP